MKSFMPWVCLVAATSSTICFANDGIDAYRQGDYNQAAQSLIRSSNSEPIAYFYLGKMRLYGYGLLKQNDMALDSFKKAGEKGYLPAQNLMARYELFIQKNPEEAFYWFKKAASQADLQAQMYCAAAYLYGYGVKRNPDRARRYYIDASKSGNAIAQYTLAEHFLESRYRSNHKLGLIWLEKSAEQGNPKAQAKLGELYVTGAFGDKDFEKAAPLLQKATQQGSTTAMYALGLLAEKKEALSTARDWFSKAAKANNTEAQVALGKLYLNKKVSFVDEKQGFLWLLKAAQGGNREARLLLSKLYATGEGVQKDENLAKEWKEKAKQSQKEDEIDARLAVATWLSNGKSTDIAASGYRLEGILTNWHNANMLKENRYNQSPQLNQVSRKELYQPQFVMVNPNQIAISDYYDALAKTLGEMDQAGFHFPHYPLNEKGVVLNVDQQILANLNSKQKQDADDEADDNDKNLGDEALKGASYKPIEIGSKEFVDEVVDQAVLGDSSAQFLLAQMYEQGKYVDKDMEKSIHFYQLAANQNDLRARYALGLIYLEGEGENPDYKKGLSLIKAAAFQGNPDAEYVLAQILERGYKNKDGKLVIKPDEEQAMGMYYLACANNHGPALYRLAEILIRQQPDNMSLTAKKMRYQLIKKLYQKAVTQGMKKAQLPLAYFNAMDENKQKQKFAFSVAEEEAAKGNPQAALLLGILYERGIGTDKDQDKAIESYEKAAANPVSQFILGTHYYQGKLVWQDEEKAKKLLMQSAQDGFPYANLNLAMMQQQKGQAFLPALEKAHQQGNSTAGLLLADYYLSKADSDAQMIVAREIYENLAKKGDAKAQLKLAYMFDNALGGKTDRQEAHTWYTASANQGQPLAQYLLGRMYQLGWSGKSPDYQASKYWFNQAMSQFTPAAVALGFIYDTVDDNYQKAFEAYQFGANKKDAVGQYNLGLIYLQGKGRAVDYQQARELFRKSADAGYPNAMTELGYLYDKGFEVSQNKETAFTWYKKAAKSNDRNALYHLGLFYETGVGTERNMEQALDEYQRSATLGNANAKMALARIYQFGQGVVKDIPKAVDYYKQLAATDNPLAQFQLAVIYYEGENGQSSEKDAKQMLLKAQKNGSPMARRALQWLGSQSNPQVSYIEPALLMTTGARGEQSANVMFLDALREWSQGDEKTSHDILVQIRKQYPEYVPAKRVFDQLNQQTMPVIFGLSQNKKTQGDNAS